MLSGMSPFIGTNEDELYLDIINSKIYFPPVISIDAVACVKLLLDRDPVKRLGMPKSPFGRIRDQKFFTRVDWDMIESRRVEPPFKPKVVSLR
jgi:hypothetical protein